MTPSTLHGRRAVPAACGLALALVPARAVHARLGADDAVAVRRPGA